MGEHSIMRGSQRVYTGRVINLDVDRVFLPNGTEAELEVIRHPGASAVVALAGNAAAPDPVLVLVRQFRHAVSGYLYEVPAGRLNGGETPIACAARELSEETGYRAEHINLLFSMFTTPGFTDERIHVFHATGLTAGVPAHETDEVMDVQEMPLSRALRLIQCGDIQDAKTALSILYFAKYSARSAE